MKSLSYITALVCVSIFASGSVWAAPAEPQQAAAAIPSSEEAQETSEQQAVFPFPGVAWPQVAGQPVGAVWPVDVQQPGGLMMTPAMMEQHEMMRNWIMSLCAAMQQPSQQAVVPMTRLVARDLPQEDATSEAPEEESIEEELPTEDIEEDIPNDELEQSHRGVGRVRPWVPPYYPPYVPPPTQYPPFPPYPPPPTFPPFPPYPPRRAHRV